MKLNHLFVLACAALALAIGLSSPVPAATEPAPVDPIAELQASEFLTVRDVLARVPHGDLTIESGVVGIFPEISRRLGGVVIGDISLELNTLPRTETFNLFKEQDGRQVRSFDVTRAYLQASLEGGAAVEPGTGYTTQVRRWDELSNEEQALFEGMVREAMADAWIVVPEVSETDNTAAAEAPETAALETLMRDPVEGEYFAAFWDEDEQRWDYRVEADGITTTIVERSSGTVYIQYPWTSEEAPAALPPLAATLASEDSVGS
jgi:hypothetical protein